MVNISKKNADGIFNLIEESKTICVIGHKSPDGDCIGSVTAMYLYLKSLGKEVNCAFDGNIPYNLESFIVEDGFFNDKDKKFDLLVVMDCADEFRLGGNMYLLDNSKHIVCIDHHKTNSSFAEYNIIIKEFSSTGELLYHLLKYGNADIDVEIATCMYVAMITDTGKFAYASTTPDTLRVAAELLEIGVNQSEIDNILFNSKPLKVFKAYNALLMNTKYYFEGKLGLVKVSQEFLDEYDIDFSSLDGVVSMIREVKEVEVSCVLKEKTINSVKISLRSKTGQVDVSKVCQKHGGGGHERAAGAEIGKSLLETEKIIVDDFSEYFS